MGKRRLEDSRECFQDRFIPCIGAILLGSHRNIFDRVLTEIRRDQIGRFWDFLNFRGNDGLGQPNQKRYVYENVNDRGAMEQTYDKYI